MMRWASLSEQVIGATHVKNNKPCQDAVLVRSYRDVFVACVADGHGSEACPFSDEGAHIAVRVVHELFETILSEIEGQDLFTMLDINKEIWIPKQIENKWKDQVKQVHAEKNSGGGDIYRLYGTTILAIVAAPEFIFALQLGDGDLMMVDSQGVVSWILEPVYFDGAATYSLCLDECWKYMQTRIIPLDSTRYPAMMLVASDGYSNSFLTQDGFLKASSDIYDILTHDGAGFVGGCLMEWLEKATVEGSGDDISLALVFDEKYVF